MAPVIVRVSLRLPLRSSPAVGGLAISAATLAAATLAAIGFPTLAAAQEPTPEQRFFEWSSLGFEPAEYASRRARLAERLREAGGGVFLAPSAHGRSRGETFRQNDDFLYLTGLELPGSVLAVDADATESILYLPARDSRFESDSRPNDFPGRPLGDDPELAARAGFTRVEPIERLEEELARWERNGRTLRIDGGRPGPVPEPETGLSPGWGVIEPAILHLRRTYPALRIENGYEAIARVRLVKSPAEIELMRRAARITAEAIAAAARSIVHGVDERSLEAAFEAACKWSGAQRVAFAPIVKSGPNSLWPWRILAAHYDRRNRAMENGELVIFDVGCELDHYVSDVGRTFPVSGRFSAEQREILEMEVAVADAVIAAVRPGVTFPELQAVAAARIPLEHRRYMQAGLFFGHHLGLSTGDPSLPDAPLEPGMIFTVEPWYYNHDLGIAVFTEDVVLVTEEGAELLTESLPRRPAALERMVGPRS